MVPAGLLFEPRQSVQARQAPTEVARAAKSVSPNNWNFGSRPIVSGFALLRLTIVFIAVSRHPCHAPRGARPAPTLEQTEEQVSRAPAHRVAPASAVFSSSGLESDRDQLRMPGRPRPPLERFQKLNLPYHPPTNGNPRSTKAGRLFFFSPRNRGLIEKAGRPLFLPYTQ